MNELSNRLLEIMSELKLASPKDLSVFCGVSEGLVSQWFSGQTKLGPKPLKAFGRTNYSLDWIVEGRLPKYRAGALEIETSDDITDAIVELVLHYQGADDRGRENIIAMARSVTKRQQARWVRLAAPDEPKQLT